MTRRPTRLLLAIIALLAQLVWLHALRGPRLLDADGTLVIGGLIVGMALVAIYPTLPTARRAQGPALGICIVIAAAVLQLAALCWLWPVLSPDVGRQRLDGLLWLSGKSPYATTIEPAPPQSAASDRSAAEHVAQRIAQAGQKEASETFVAGREDVNAAADRSPGNAVPPASAPVKGLGNLSTRTAETIRRLNEKSAGAAAVANDRVSRVVEPDLSQAALPAGADLLDRAALPIRPPTDPPVAQTIFVAARALEMVTIGPARAVMPAEPPPRTWRAAIAVVGGLHRAVVMRLFSAIAAVAAAVLTLRILRAAGKNPWFAVLLAWNPLLTIEAAGNGRVAVIGIALLLTMVRLLQKRNATFATVALVLACGVEPTAILLAPLLVREINASRSWRVARRCIIVALSTLAATYLPVLIGRGSLRGWITAIATSTQLREGNSAVFAAIRSAFKHAGGTFDGNFLRAILLLATPIAAAVVLAHVLRHRRPLAECAYWLLLIPLLFRPAIDPPAALWPLAFVPLLTRTPGWAAITWAATIGIAYAAWHVPGGVLPTRIVLAEYVPVAVALFVEYAEGRRGRKFIPQRSLPAKAA